MKRILIIFGALVVTGLILWFFLRKNKDGDSEFPLKYGSRGENVARLQKWLNTYLHPDFKPLVVDGIFGPKTDVWPNRGNW